MRKQTIFSRLLVPMMVSLLLLPPLSCLIFHQTAKQYAYNEAVRELTALQERIVPIMEHSFSDTNEVDPIKAFLGKAGPLASQMGGNARLLILAGEMQVIYPRDEQLREAVAPLAEEFAKYIQSGSTPETDGASFRDRNGETYLVNVYEAPVQSKRLRYIITLLPGLPNRRVGHRSHGIGAGHCHCVCCAGFRCSLGCGPKHHPAPTPYLPGGGKNRRRQLHGN